MITKEEAFESVRQRIADLQEEIPSEDELIILEQKTVEKEWGWVVFWTSRLWNEGGFKYALAGNAPFIVQRKDGKLFETGTAHSIDHYIEQFEETGNPHD